MKSQLPRSFVLSNGVEMPSVGLGTYQMNEDELKLAIKVALDVGYRMFDTAANYKNEGFIGEILARELMERDMKRSDVFIITKLSPKDQGYDKTVDAMRKSASLLGGYIDLYLIHWPGVSKTDPSSAQNAVGRCESWLAMQDIYSEAAQTQSQSEREGTGTGTDTGTGTGAGIGTGIGKPLVRAIGVSNYHVVHLQALLADPALRVPPAVNQVELHPCYHPTDLRKFCTDAGVHLQAYSPLGRGNLLAPEFLRQFPEVRGMVREGGEGLACVYLKWALQNGFSVLPKSRDGDRIRGNIAMFDDGNGPPHGTSLSPDQMRLLDQVQNARLEKFCWDSQSVA